MFVNLVTTHKICMLVARMDTYAVLTQVIISDKYVINKYMMTIFMA